MPRLAASEGGLVSTASSAMALSAGEVQKRLIPEPDWRYMHGHIPVRYSLEQQPDWQPLAASTMDICRCHVAVCGTRVIDWFLCSNYVCSNPRHLRHETVRADEIVRDLILENQGKEQRDFLAAAGVSPAWQVLISAVDGLDGILFTRLRVSCSSRDGAREAFGQSEFLTSDFLRHVPDFRPMKRSEMIPRIC